MKRLTRWILWIFGISAGLILGFYILLYCYKIPIIIPIKEGAELHFTNEYDKTYGTPSRKERISLHPVKGIVISGSWHSDNGFQQTALVKNGKERMHEDSRKRIRRALCNESKDGCLLMIVESATPMTLSDFAKELSKICYTAVNLDTGNYGYGWYGKMRFSRWAYYNRNRQTNWICIK